MKLKNSVYALNEKGESQFIEAIKNLLNKDQPLKTCYEIVKIAKEVGTKYAMYVEVRQGIFKKYGEDKDGQIHVSAENKEKFAEFISKLRELDDIEEEFDIKKIKLEDCTLKSQDVFILDPILIQE